MFSLETLLLRRFALRHWRLAPRQSLLLVGILALGVAVFVAVRLANRAAVASFTHFTDTITGQSDWIIQPAAGTLPESVLPELRAALGSRPVHIFPVVESTAARVRRTDESANFGRTTFTLLGVDLIAVANLARAQSADASYFGQQGGTEATSDFWAAFRAGPQIWLSSTLATSLGAARTLDLVINEQVHALPIAGVIPTPKDAPRVPANLILLDLPQLQRLA